MKHCSILFICLFVICCTRNVEQNEIIGEPPLFAANNDEIEDVDHFTPQSEILETEFADEYDNRIVAYSTMYRGVSLKEIRYNDISFQDLPTEEKGLAFKDGSSITASSYGISCLTNIIDDNVNVRNYPSLEAAIIYKLNNNDIIHIIGSSGDGTNIDNFYGDWVNIIYQKSEDEYINGWVFSKYVNTKDREYTPIRFVEFIPGPSPYENNLRMRISYVLQGNEIFDGPDYTDWNNYYIIVWGPFDNCFHYTNKPGIYLLDKETLELSHITYLGSFGPTAHVWTIFSDDFEYLIQDSGTSPGVRGITAWRWKDMELVFKGIYYRSPNIHNNIIEIVYFCNDWYFEHGYVDEEIMLYGKKYKEENLVPQEIESQLIHPTLSIELLVKCSFNLDTGERKILNGEYIITN
jgi:hypothetical protein